MVCLPLGSLIAVESATQNVSLYVSYCRLLDRFRHKGLHQRLSSSGDFSLVIAPVLWDDISSVA